jgi:hypothetical protein
LATSIAARRAEIACRYKGAKRERPHLAPIRIAELCRLFRARYGATLPDDDAGREDARIMAHHLAHMSGDPRIRIRSWLNLWAPWMPPEEATSLIEAVLAKPLRYRADTLGKRLNLTEAERTRLSIRTIGAIDTTKEQRMAARMDRKRQAKCDRRRAQGVKPRAEYEATAIGHGKPWEAEGVSKATWYRRKRGAKQ